jgi:hypothetical protein
MRTSCDGVEVKVAFAEGTEWRRRCQAAEHWRRDVGRITLQERGRAEAEDALTIWWCS